MKRILFILLIAAASFAALAPQHAPTARAAEDGCELLNNSEYDSVYGYASTGPVSFAAGSVITFEAEYIKVEEDRVAQNGLMVYLEFEGNIVDSASVPGTMSYTFTEDTELSNVSWYTSYPPALVEPTAAARIEVDWTVSCDGSLLVPGCDALINLPSTSVVGAFVGNAQTYWGADLDKATSTPSIVIPAGKTAWVLGVDASGSFYKILWGCTFLWVPVETMGPNYDNVWQGTPLPVNVVN